MKKLLVSLLLALSLLLGTPLIVSARPALPTVQSSAQCVFEVSVTQNCQSTNPDIVLNLHNFGDTSQCSFATQVNWGDGSAVQSFTVPGGPNGSEYLSGHMYSVPPGTYQIQATGSVLSGSCTFSGATYQFTLLAPGCTPKITSVSSFPAQQSPTVVIRGSCFGTFNTFSNTDSPYFKITINPSTASEWHACYTGDAPADSVTCTVSSWTDTSIDFNGFTGQYGQNGWVVKAGDSLNIQVWNAQTNQGPDTCTVIVGTTGTTQCHNNCTPDYCIPQNWNTLSVGGFTPGVEPLNVIISARSTVPLSSILAALNGWDQVPTGILPHGCLSPEEANVTGSYGVQQQSWRVGNCTTGNARSLTGKENHARFWQQPVSGSLFGAWFISASYETLCVQLPNKDMAPVLDNRIYSINHPTLQWHCIDGSKNSDGTPSSFGSNGYDHGAMKLANDIVKAAHNKGWHAVMRTDTRPTGTGEGGVAFSGAVYVVTVG